MKKRFEDKIKKKEEEIQSFINLEGKDLFNRFTMEEKINNIRSNNNTKKFDSKLSTNENSIKK